MQPSKIRTSSGEFCLCSCWVEVGFEEVFYLGLLDVCAPEHAATSRGAQITSYDNMKLSLQSFTSNIKPQAPSPRTTSRAYPLPQ